MTEPVTLVEAKAQVRMADDTSEDTFITSLIAAARAYVERASRYSFVAGTRTETFTRWGDYLEIYRHGVATITGVTYSTTADSGDDADYTGFVANLGFPARIAPAVDAEFPDLIAGGTITVEYTTTALDATSEEYLIGKRAMLLLIGHWYEFREAAAAGIVSNEIAFAISSMLDELRPVSAY